MGKFLKIDGKDLIRCAGTVILVSVILFLVLPLAIVEECWGKCDYNEPGEKVANIGHCGCLRTPKEQFSGHSIVLFLIPIIAGTTHYLKKNKAVNWITSLVILIVYGITSFVALEIYLLMAYTLLT